MDILLSRLTQQAVNYAVKTGVAFAASYTIQQCGMLIQQSPKSQENGEMIELQRRLENSTRIISPAIDMIELISARGNTTLEPAVALAKEIRRRIYALGLRIENLTMGGALDAGENRNEKVAEARKKVHATIVAEMKNLVLTMENAVPLINLAITTSGINLSTKMAATISPSRLVQASTLLTAADTAWISQPKAYVQVGPTFVVSLYMLFAGHAQTSENAREAMWKEVMHKAEVKLFREPVSNVGASTVEIDGVQSQTKSLKSFAYKLVITEDLDDGRVHCDDNPVDVADATGNETLVGLEEVVPVQQLSKIFYADTGKILGISDDSETHSPVLLLKRDLSAKTLDRYSASDPVEELANDSIQDNFAKSTNCLPADLDPEWMALEAYSMDDDNASSSEDERGVDSSHDRRRSSQAWLSSNLARLSLRAISSSPSPASGKNTKLKLDTTLQSSEMDEIAETAVQTSLSLLEMLVKLVALQQFRQDSHLAIEDEFLNFFLIDSSSIGLGSDADQRRALRQQASRRVGFDPYDASPIKQSGMKSMLIDPMKTPHGEKILWS